MKIRLGSDQFEVRTEMIDVTSMHRPDTAGWAVTDPMGHLHVWVDIKTQEARPGYSPRRIVEVPTLVFVEDYRVPYEDGDGEEIVGHHECRLCGHRVEPGYTADTWTQYVPGPRTCLINGEVVSSMEFERRLAAAKAAHGM